MRPEAWQCLADWPKKICHRHIFTSWVNSYTTSLVEPSLGQRLFESGCPLSKALKLIKNQTKLLNKRKGSFLILEFKE